MAVDKEKVDWPEVINVGVAMPTIICTGLTSGGFCIAALAIFVFCSVILLRMGVRREFANFVFLTRMMIVSTPVWFFMSWLTFVNEASFATRVTMVIILGFLHIVSNLLMKSRYKSAA